MLMGELEGGVMMSWWACVWEVTVALLIGHASHTLFLQEGGLGASLLATYNLSMVKKKLLQFWNRFHCQWGEQESGEVREDTLELNEVVEVEHGAISAEPTVNVAILTDIDVVGEARTPLPAQKEEDHCIDVEFSHITKRWMYKNAVGLGLGFLFVFSAFNGLQNLQSSLHSEGGLGLASLAIVYVVFILSCFISPGVIKVLGTKYALLGGFFFHLLYTTANYYPSWYTLVPASLIIGIGSGPIWTAGSAHLVKVAVLSAPKLGLDQNLVISNLVSIFFFFFRMSQIPGNLASSLIFFPYSVGNETTDYKNSSTSDKDLCEKKDDRVLDSLYLYILVSVYFIMISIGIIIHCTLVSHLPVERERNLSGKKWCKVYLKNPVVDIFKIMTNYKLILVVPLAVATGLELSFAYGTFTQIIVARCFGTYLVGFAIMVLGIVGALAAMTFGKLVKWIPRYILFLFGGGINIGLLIFLLLWRLSPSYVVVFVFISLWAIADAVWNTMTSSLVGILFPTQSELAYSVHRIWQSIGLVVGFVGAQFLSFRGRCYVTLVAIVVALVSNLVLEFKTQTRESLLPWFLRSVKCSVLLEDKQEGDKELSPD